MEALEQSSEKTIVAMDKQIKELKSELEGKEDSFHFAITDLQNENQLLCDRIARMKRLAGIVIKFAESIMESNV